jgi:microcystin degradation protein MlrC
VRVFLAQCSQETGSFLPVRATLDWFEQHLLTEGDGLLRAAAGRRLELAGALAAARAHGAAVAPGLAAWAMPWGILEGETYATLRARLLASLEGARRTGPVDAALLVLHGAMQAEGTDDPEGDLLAAVRAALGSDVPLVGTLDLHANVTAAMLAAADALVAYQTVPHVDMYETGYAAMDLAVRAARGEVRPVTAGRKLPLVTPAETHDTRTAPMAPLMAAGRELARGPVLRASLCAAQPWLDVPELGWTALAVGDADRVAAQRAADALAAQAWRARETFLMHKLPVAEVARRAALAPPGRPVVVSDSGDNTSGGAPGDSVHLLRGLLDAVARGGPRVEALLWLADAGAARACAAAGAGAAAAVSLGHAHDRRFGTPLKVRIRVVRVVPEARYVIRGPSWTGTPMTLGLAAVVDVLDGGAAGEPRARLVVCERPVMDIDPGLYRCVGETPVAYRLVQVRSPAAFRATYEPMASEIVSVESPGPTTSDLPSLPWTKAPRPLFPLDSHTTFPGADG